MQFVHEIGNTNGSQRSRNRILPTWSSCFEPRNYWLVKEGEIPWWSLGSTPLVFLIPSVVLSLLTYIVLARGLQHSILHIPSKSGDALALRYNTSYYMSLLSEILFDRCLKKEPPVGLRPSFYLGPFPVQASQDDGLCISIGCGVWFLFTVQLPMPMGKDTVCSFST